MEPPKVNFERKLLTIMSADVVGYSRLMAKEEEKTLEIFIRHKKIFEDEVIAHKGRIFNTAGDAILAEFPSAVEAVYCATRIQEQLWEMNKNLDPAKAVAFRIGLNLGDVLVQGTDLLGDGVNVAARIQTAAQPGGVCISGSVYDQIQEKMKISTLFMGEKIYKNIPKPVRTYAVNFPGRKQPVQKSASAISRKSSAGIYANTGSNFSFILALAFFVAVIAFIISTKESGYQLNVVTCNLASSDIPSNFVDPSLKLNEETKEILKQTLDCNKYLNCYARWKPWLNLDMNPNPLHASFGDQEFFIGNKSAVSTFSDKTRSSIHVRAIRYKSESEITWGTEDCSFTAFPATIYPGFTNLLSKIR